MYSVLAAFALEVVGLFQFAHPLPHFGQPVSFVAGGTVRDGLDGVPLVEPGDVEVALDLRPAPAVVQQLVGLGLQPLVDHAVQQLVVLQVDAPFVVLGEQVPADDAAGLLVGLDPDQLRGAGRGGHVVLGQHPLDGGRFRHRVLRADPLPDRELVLVVLGDGEGRQQLDVDLVGPERCHELRCAVGQAQQLLDLVLGHAEAVGDVQHADTLIDEALVGLELIGRVHAQPHRVLVERELQVGVVLAGAVAGGAQVVVGLPEYPAGDRMCLGNAAVGRQGSQRQQAPAARGHREHRLGPGAAVARHQVLEEPVGLDGRLQLRQGIGPGDGRAGVVLGQLQLVQRDVADCCCAHVGCSFSASAMWCRDVLWFAPVRVAVSRCSELSSPSCGYCFRK